MFLLFQFQAVGGFFYFSLELITSGESAAFMHIPMAYRSFHVFRFSKCLLSTYHMPDTASVFQ